jgi:uncharacterized protein
MANEAGLLAVAFWTGILVLVSLWLLVHVVRVRIRTGVMMGDAGNPAMIRAMRGQANFVEVVPLALLVILAMALLGAPAWLVHGFGAALALGRVLHALHFTAEDAPRWQRGAGTGLSMLVLGLGGLGVAVHALARMV